MSVKASGKRSGGNRKRLPKGVADMPGINQRYNPNQMKFLMEMIKNGGNKSEAYRVAYDYTGKNANEMANRVLSMPGARELLGAMQERAYLAAGIDAAQVLGETAKIAFHNPKDLYDKKTGKAIPIHKLPRGIASVIKKMEVHLDKKGRPVGTTYETIDRTVGLKMIGGHLGTFKNEGSTEVNVNLIVERMEAGRKRALESRNLQRLAKPIEGTVIQSPSDVASDG